MANMETMADRNLKDEFVIGDYCLERLSPGLFSVLDWDAQLCNPFAQGQGSDSYYWELNMDGIILCSGTFLDIYKYIKAGWVPEIYD